MTVEPNGQAGQSLNAAALAVLGHIGGKRSKQALAVIAAAQIVAPIAQEAYRRIRRRDDYSVTVKADDPVYPDLLEWVLARLPDTARKALIASTVLTRSNDVPGDAVSDSASEEAELRLRYDGSRVQLLNIDGHKVAVTVMREDLGRDRDNWSMLVEKITFTASNAEGRDAVVRMIDGLLTEKFRAPRPPALFVPSRWGGGWTRRGDLPARTLDSVVLKRGQLERLLGDLAAFLAAEDEYNRLSQPWHRGYLFHGAPGTGKTSAARALANHFGLPTYYLPLGDIAKDTDLMTFVSQIEPRSVLLIEDIDVFHAATERDDEAGKASLAAMLNALDGVWTPHGLITVMTTNDRDRLDDALVRAGRIDVTEEFGPLDRDQAERLAEFLEADHLNAADFVGESPSALIEQARVLPRLSRAA